MRDRLIRTLAGFALATVASAAGAQQTGEFAVVEMPGVEVAAPLLTVDIDQLFSQSAFGRRIARDFNEEREALAIENRRIADALREEELALTRQRATMDPNVFRTEAEEFDAKTQAIRRAQDAKETALDEMLTNGRDQFLSVTRPILGQLMIDYGAVAILDRRSVLLSLSSVDITEEAAARIDATIGDGTSTLEEPIPAPEIAPEIPADPAPEMAPNDAPDVIPDN